MSGDWGGLRSKLHDAGIDPLAGFIGEFADLQSFFDAVVCQVARATDVDHVKILRYRPEAGDLLREIWSKGQPALAEELLGALGLAYPSLASMASSTDLRLPRRRS